MDTDGIALAGFLGFAGVAYYRFIFEGTHESFTSLTLSIIGVAAFLWILALVAAPLAAALGVLFFVGILTGFVPSSPSQLLKGAKKP